MNELVINEDALNSFQVNFTKGKVEIVGFSEIYKSLQMLSDYLVNVEVTEDNIKENKKLVARVSKATKEMNQARIENKRRFMEPFEIYEEQVKSLTKLVSDAEETIRSQIRELEEIEREEKKIKLSDIFEKRRVHYEYSDFMDFGDFLQPRHLNKSVSMEKVEQEMVEWLETFNKDLRLLKSLSDDGHFEFDEALADYLEYGNVTDVLDHFTKREEKKKKAKECVRTHEAKKKGLDHDTVQVLMNTDDFRERVEPILLGMAIQYICI